VYPLDLCIRTSARILSHPLLVQYVYAATPSADVPVHGLPLPWVGDRRSNSCAGTGCLVKGERIEVVRLSALLAFAIHCRGLES
jgi:hypothetical protein